ncbi:MAG: hypothetical protein DME04_08230 [Candidatus Rokuibacteriota bacterium]|nr:MAG: hypothetical protein DME04_08230 [Candidatus Rokubacteria bacterium]
MTWGLLGLMFLLFALVVGPAPALAWDVSQFWVDTNTLPADVILYEVTEDMYLRDAAGNFVSSPTAGGRRSAVAELSGWAKLGSPLCPSWVLLVVPTTKKCAVNARGADDLSLATGKGTLSGAFSVVVQDINQVDAAEFVIMTGTFFGDADLSPAFAGVAPLGYIKNGVLTIDGSDLKASFSGTFRLPVKIKGYVSDLFQMDAYYISSTGLPIWVKANERSLGVPTVRIEIKF